jgi:hypothetical protein
MCKIFFLDFFRRVEYNKNGKGVVATQNQIFLPKTDIIFKWLFGSAKNVHILKDFLKAVLNLPDSEFVGISITDPHLRQEGPGDKLGILDVKLETADGHKVRGRSASQKRPGDAA